jgi:hypothetical protein
MLQKPRILLNILPPISRAWLPDGLFSNQKSQFLYILEGLAMEYVGIFYGHLVTFSAIWSIICPFGVFYGHLVYFMAIWYILWPFGKFYGQLVYLLSSGIFPPPRLGMWYKEICIWQTRSREKRARIIYSHARLGRR